jgi:hypothetical protein
MPDERHHIQYVPEPPDIRMNWVGWAAAGALLLLITTIGGFYGIYRVAVPSRNLPAPQTFPAPRVDTTESEQLRHIRDEQNQKLETWRWSNDQHTLVQVPIERAMRLLAQKDSAAYDPLLPAETGQFVPEQPK